MAQNRIFGLDLLRALAITCVLIAHTAFLVTPKHDFAITYIFGFLGVELFFVLSGFLIGGILIKSITESGELKFKLIKSFWIRRWFRTLPNYYLVFVLNSINEVFYRHTYNFNFLTYLVFAQNLVSPYPKFFGVSWSLSIEEWFYLTFPIVLFIIYKLCLKFKNTFKPLDALFYAVVFYLAGCLIFRILFSSFSDMDWDKNFRKIVLLRLDTIAIGVLFAFLKHKYSNLWQIQKRNMLWLSISSIIVLYSYFISDFIILQHESFFLKTFFFTFTSLSLAFSLPLIENIKQFKNKRANNFVLNFSLYSYSMYLIHLLVIQYVDSKTANRIFGSNDLVKLLLVWILIYIISAYQYKYFEKPLTQLRERWK